MNLRWSVGFFFALVSIPFSYVWLVTQGPQAFDRLFPVYEVTKIAHVEQVPTGYLLHGVTFESHHECKPEGALYVSGVYLDGDLESEVLLMAEAGQDSGPVILRQVSAGTTFTVPEIRLSGDKSLFQRVTKFRFMQHCVRPFVGKTHSYSNIILLQ